jgi:signal transduction histidine kinase
MTMRELIASIAHEVNQPLAAIVEAHGGVLCATRKESPGSVFQFTVPLIHPPISIQN